MKIIKAALLGLLMISNAWAAKVPEARLLHNEPMRFGDYEVYFSAFNSTFITPDIAHAYKLERSPKHGLVNIAVRNVKDSELGKAIPVRLEGQYKNFLQQYSSMTFKEVKEGEAIYYLAGFKFSNEEMLEFNIDVIPEGSSRNYTVKFRQKFYQDGK